jgi:zinc transporter
MDLRDDALSATGQRRSVELLPGLVFAFRFEADGRAQEIHPRELPDLAEASASSSWYWLNFNLADKRASHAIGQSHAMPEAARALLVGQHDHQQLYASADCVYGVFSDLIRDFDRANEQTGHLHFAITEHLVVTGRRQPLQALEAVRTALARGRRATNAASLIELIVAEATVGIDELLEDLARELDHIEDQLLIESISDERRRVGRVRRTGVRLHRQLAALRVLLKRFDISEEIAEKPALLLDTDRLVQRLDALDQEVVTVQERARLLQDEIGARLSDETNKNVNALAVMTALFLPPTLVTGIFGMNTSGLPLTSAHHGSLWAMGLAIAAAAGAYFLLRRMGIIRR